MTPSPAPSRHTKSRATGPRTQAGKAASSQNALRHGLASETLLIPGENPSDFHALLTDLLTDWNPDSSTERLLVEDLAKHRWLMDRALRLQAQVLTKAAEGELPPAFAVLLRYQTANQRAYMSAIRLLETLQKTRREFVSQNEKSAALAARSAALSRLATPPPPMNLDWYYEQMRAASASSQPATPTTE